MKTPSSVNLTEISVNLTEISVKGQFGTSYRATKSDRADSNATLNVDYSLQGEKVSMPSTIFVKCPAEGSDPSYRLQFVANEYANGPAINHAASRIEASAADTRSKLSFNIVRMIGRGNLVRRGGEPQPCLLYEYGGDSKLTDSTLAARQVEPYKGGAGDFLNFAHAFSRVIQVLHNQGIVHTYIVPRNIIWRKNKSKASLSHLNGGFTLVGFGYARLLDTAGKDRQFKSTESDNMFRAPECRSQHRSHAAFGFPADIYSIGAILYWLLVGPTIQASILTHPPADNRRLKRLIAETLGRDQVKLVHDNENILKIIDSCLRYDAEHRYSCVEELIEAIEIASAAGQSTSKAPLGMDRSETSRKKKRAIAVDQEVNKIVENAPRECDGNKVAPYFTEMNKAITTDYVLASRRIGRGHLEVFGHRDRIVASLCRLLGSATKGDKYRTMTLPDYWTDDNLGSNGRFLTMNKHMARKGVSIERLFLVTEDFHELPEEEQAILEEQLLAVEDLRPKTGPQENSMAGNPIVDPMIIKVYKVDANRIAGFERNGELVAYMESKAGSKTCLNFFSTVTESRSLGEIVVRRRIKKVRYWDPDFVQRSKQFEDSKLKFESHLKSAVMLEEYIRPPNSPVSVEKVTLKGLVYGVE